jgi:hypothetical protein
VKLVQKTAHEPRLIGSFELVGPVHFAALVYVFRTQALARVDLQLLGDDFDG